MAAFSEEKRSLGLVVRVVIGTVALIMVPPFVVLAMAPMLLMLSPVALVAIPFMISAFAGEAREVQPTPRRVHALAHAHG